ncbi:threonine aldolase family protein [Pseudomonas typographi]|uniref:threonine aldolase family protein n=1 Tax=Pseudomonas typographi TaxID=2715964 RepID=UPI0016859AD2|nr:GntG family PLP-dependent aldolase [Pseudomonas typographi]MBD1586849.1 aminotransferase class I/II-fold pyridoxal phosphate-dependent enzyme [Pseudomonas typographi]
MSALNAHDGGAGITTPVDLRSDTVTRPTQEMYEAMRAAPIGDDGLDFDPSVRALEEGVAGLLGKEQGLFVPSCTMANLLAVLAQTGRSEQVLLESTAHMFTSERGAATFTGLFYLGVRGQHGAMNLNEAEEALKGGTHKLHTGLLAMETSHNNAGGTVPALDHMAAVYRMAESRGVPVHLDGARLFNAAVALGVAAEEMAASADTVSVCLSKGLSAPVGAVLVGPSATLARARRLRRMLGGTQRQAGIMAAAGLYAVQNMVTRLSDDHRHALMLSTQINQLGLAISASQPQTNIVQVDISKTGLDSLTWVDNLERAGLRVRPWGADRLRCVTHRHIDDDDIHRAVQCFRAVLKTGPDA